MRQTSTPCLTWRTMHCREPACVATESREPIGNGLSNSIPKPSADTSLTIPGAASKCPVSPVQWMWTPSSAGIRRCLRWSTVVSPFDSVPCVAESMGLFYVFHAQFSWVIWLGQRGPRIPGFPSCSQNRNRFRCCVRVVNSGRFGGLLFDSLCVRPMLNLRTKPVSGAAGARQY